MGNEVGRASANVVGREGMCCKATNQFHDFPSGSLGSKATNNFTIVELVCCTTCNPIPISTITLPLIALQNANIVRFAARSAASLTKKRTNLRQEYELRKNSTLFQYLRVNNEQHQLLVLV